MLLKRLVPLVAALLPLFLVVDAVDQLKVGPFTWLENRPPPARFRRDRSSLPLPGLLSFHQGARAD